VNLFLDFETASELLLDERGLDNYANHPSTHILMLAWAVDDEEPELWTPSSQLNLPDRLHQLLLDPTVIKTAWNASFERTILRAKCGVWVPYEQWLDPMVWARHLSLPGKLEQVGPILGLPVEESKLAEGKELIKWFCEPVVAAREETLFGPIPAVFRTRQTDPEKWVRFEEYCRQDLRTMRANLRKMQKFPLPESESKLWYLDQEINDTGLPIDMEFVDGCATVAEQAKADLAAQLKTLTNLENPNSTDQMLAFVQSQGYPFSSIGKAMVNRALAGEGSLTELGKQVLTIRQQFAKTASSKLDTIRQVVSADGRLRDAFTFMGAARTARWSAHGFQPHNFPRPTKDVENNYARALELLRAGDYATIKREFDSPLDVVGSCLRSTVAAPKGYHFDVCDLSAIEPRITAVVSGCETLLNVFRENRDPYLDFGSRMYKKPYDEITHQERQISKSAVLGCCYQLSGGEEMENKDGDLVKTGLWGYAESMHVEMTRTEAHQAVKFYRSEYSEVVSCWYNMEEAALVAIRTKQPQRVGPVTFQAFSNKLLRILLPSGRGLHYIRPQIHSRTYTDRYGRERERDSITYEGIDSQTRQWVRIDTFGGHFFENVVQAIARDVLGHGLLLARAAGFVVVGHVHDEGIALTPDGSKLTLDNLISCLVQKSEWMPSLLLAATGYQDTVYRKD
jgi:DNA polymerase bacteriophage-type